MEPGRYGEGMVQVSIPSRLDEPPPEAAPVRWEIDFDTFYHANYQAITVQLTAYTGDLGLAQDLVQEAFCRAYARWGKVTAYDDPVAWAP
jgi:RNA polymerase sigma-70 factor, ECF subfamily